MWKRRLLAAVAAAVFAGPVAAFDVVPTVSVLELPEAAAGRTLVVRNPRTVDLPVAFEVFERTVAEDGSETYTPADNSFLVFPPQAVVKAGGTQAVRVRWIGETPPRSRSFTLYAAEIPVDLSGAETTTVQTVMRMGASVHVTPKAARPRPVLAASAPAPDEEGVRVTVTNEGDRFYYIDQLTLEFPDRTIAGRELADVAQRTLVPPGGRRTFVVPEVAGAPRLSVTP